MPLFYFTEKEMSDSIHSMLTEMGWQVIAFREPEIGERFVNANSIDPRRANGIRPFVMRMGDNTLDREIRDTRRWIVKPLPGMDARDEY